MQFIGINETVLDDFPDFSSDESNSTEWGYQVGTLTDHPS
ncbi:22060_t:CDS:2 [Rhizophagus irregularis]|nr:22060_t:CDS:2 [Rhizophagus irregularis]